MEVLVGKCGRIVGMSRSVTMKERVAHIAFRCSRKRILAQQFFTNKKDKGR